MADFTIFSDISFYLVDMLRENLCPEPIPQANSIQVTTPLEQDTDYLLGLYLYDLAEEKDDVVIPVMTSGKIRIQNPPRAYALYYMLFPNGTK